MKKLLAFALLLGAISCSQPATDQYAAEDEGDYSIASSEYVDLAQQGLEHMAAKEFGAWTNMMADDVEYNFPDGDQNTRTSLVGKEAVQNWWSDWSESAGVESMTFTASNHVPINAKNPQNTTGMAGIYVISFFSNEMSFSNGNTANLRMNVVAHFNEDKMIDRYYSYYDRTGIITAMGVNILGDSDEDGQ